MKTQTHLSVKILFIIIIGVACSKEEMSKINPYQDVSDQLEKIPAYNQRSGNRDVGREYLLYGDYVDSGIPVELFSSTLGSMTEARNELNRGGVNADIPFSFTQIENRNGIHVVVPNCMQCHAGYVDGAFVFGLGNTMFDNTIDQGAVTPFLDRIVKTRYGDSSPEYEAFQPFARALTATKGQLVTEVVGANSADKLAVVLAAHRNKDDLTWSDVPLSEIPDEVIPADVPAWWLLKKKNAMFSTGIGRKDFARLMMASSILTMQDSSKAREVDDQFADVLAYINSLVAPSYPGSIDTELAAQGQMIFEETCAKCHGTYGDNSSYPNFLVSHEILETDPALAMSNYAYSGFSTWYNDSWFSKGQYGAMVVPTDGYIAPPLDGVWATAPYLHNGSVPTLEDLLNSTQRPVFWRKSLEEKNYDHKKLGLKYTVETIKKDRWTYDTSIKGYNHSGHYFADHLTSNQRLSLLEYLKTL
jgi:cytochrome c5